MICLPDYLEKPIDCLHCWIPCDINNYNKCPVIEIVQCKNCRYYEETDSRIGTCLLTISGAVVDGFCAWGERRNEHGRFN